MESIQISYSCDCAVPHYGGQVHKWCFNKHLLRGRHLCFLCAFCKLIWMLRNGKSDKYCAGSSHYLLTHHLCQLILILKNKTRFLSVCFVKMWKWSKNHLSMLSGCAFHSQNLAFSALVIVAQKGFAFHAGVALQNFLVDKLPTVPFCILSLKLFLIGFI